MMTITTGGADSEHTEASILIDSHENTGRIIYMVLPVHFYII